MEDDVEIEMSPLCQKLTDSGKTVRVDIYRGEEKGWILEVVDAGGTSTVWEDLFTTDAEALEEVKATIRDEGIDVLIGLPK
ncbi:hypothetical protein [Halomonas sp.]|uniref:hypothetical protein n=1 Tax=Halomonas sp. TaxID=1486246 RepID=UPI00257F5229|nr:hypothetical protein [Halomonas sp.]MCJ8287630.1 hypothetical protein [Halomonas sp.]NQY72352.1 hypothetical protein [Halomonas sp.]